MWLKPQIQGSNADNNEAQSTRKNFPAFTLIKDQNKHENIRVSENFFNEDFAKKIKLRKTLKISKILMRIFLLKVQKLKTLVCLIVLARFLALF